MVKSVNPVPSPDFSVQSGVGKTGGDAAKIAATTAWPEAPVQSVTPSSPAVTSSPRLVIEESQGQFIYKTLDPSTGEVLSQLPREELLKAQEKPETKPGMVIDTRQ